MKHYSILLAVFIAAVTCSSLLAQEKAALQPTATLAGILQGSTGKKMGGKVGQVTDNIVHLSNLTGAEYFDAFIDVKDVAAVIIRTGGK